MNLKYLERTSKFVSDVIMKNITLFITASFLGLMGYHDIQKFIFEVGAPLCLSYVAGNNIEKKNGGIVAIIAASGVIVQRGFPTLLGPIGLGVISGISVRYFNRFIKRHIKPGYEMLCSNLGLSVIGIFFSVQLYKLFNPVWRLQMEFLRMGHEKFSGEAMMALTFLVEPLKVFFLNNIINHGVFTVLGASEVMKSEKSLFFFLETNPGPGFGLLLAMYYYQKKKEMLSSSLIVLIGGVHELYFVPVLKKLHLLIPLIAGSLSGIAFNFLFNTGLKGIVSPGSILMIELMAPKGDKLLVFISVAFSAVITFYLSSIFLKKEVAPKGMKENEPLRDENLTFSGIPEKILIVCDAGMGSSAMGASFLRQKLMKRGIYDIEIDNSSIENFLDKEADLVIMHKEIHKRTGNKGKGTNIVTIEDFLDGNFYEKLIDRFLEEERPAQEGFINKKNIRLGLQRVSKDEALIKVGENLYEEGYVKKEYIKSIVEREDISTTYLENGVAMPHGTQEGRKYIRSAGIVVHQYPYGIDYGNGRTVYVLIGVAAKGDEHMKILTKLAEIIDDDERINKLCMAVEDKEICEILDWEGFDIDK